MRLELLAGVLALAAEEIAPDELIARATKLLAAALGDIVATFVEILPGPALRPRYTTSPAGLPGKLPVIPEAIWTPQERPLVVEDVLAVPRLEPAWPILEARNVRAAVDVPLRRNGQLVAAMWFNSSTARRWTGRQRGADALGGRDPARAHARAGGGAWEQRERAAAELRTRDAILEAITRSARTLLAEADWRDAAPKALARAWRGHRREPGDTFENGVDDRGRPVMSQRFEWAADGVTAELDNPAMQNLCWEEAGLARMRDVVGGNEVFAGIVAELPRVGSASSSRRRTSARS